MRSVCWRNNFTNFSSKDKSKQSLKHHRSGHKRAHDNKFQRLIGNLSGPYVGKRHYSTTLHGSGLLTNLQRSAWHNSQPLCIFGDSGYPLSIYPLAPFSSQNLTSNPVFVVWLFDEIKTYAVGKIYCWSSLLLYFWGFLVHLLRLPSLAFLLYCIIGRKLSAYLTTLPNLSFRSSKKSIFEKWNFIHLEDFRQMFLMKFQEAIFWETICRSSHQGEMFCKKRCS